MRIREWISNGPLGNRATLMTLGLLAGVAVLGQFYVSGKDAVSLRLVPAPEAWRLQFQVPEGWVSDTPHTDLLGWKTVAYRDPHSMRLLRVGRLLTPAGSTGASLAKWVLDQRTLDDAYLAGETSEADARLGHWPARQIVWDLPGTMTRQAARIRVLGAVSQSSGASGDLKEAYTIELSNVSSSSEPSDRLWAALLDAVKIEERQP